MTMQLRKAINNYKPVNRKVLPTRQTQGGSRGLAGHPPVPKRTVHGTTKTRSVPRPAQGQN